MRYVELAVTTNFSFLRGASHPEELAAQAKALGLAGIGIADRNSVAGVVRAHEAAKEHGIRLAVGARLVFIDGTPDIFSFPQDRAGWAKLTRLLTLGKRRAEKGACTLFLDDLLAHAAGLNLIVLVDASKRTMPLVPSPLAGEDGEDYRSEPGKGKKRIPAQALYLHPPPRSGGGEPPEGRGRGRSGFACSVPPPPCTQPSLRRLRKLACDAWSPSPVSRGRMSSDQPTSHPRLAMLTRLREAACGSVWLGVSMLYRGDDARRLARLADLGLETKIPLIAVGDVLYHAPERRALQDVVTCIREHLTLDSAGRRLEANAERHLKPAEEMARLFRAAPQAVAETLRFLDRCRFSLDELAYDYPDEIREGFATPQEALVAFAEEGARHRYPHGVPAKVRHALDHEYALIGELNYAPYFLTVHDIVRFARGRGILCQGRGSAANSAVCYCLGVTEVDPERSDLLFERFVSAERREPPDIDVDFEHERREDVIQYIYRRYGRERAGLAATVICYRGRSAIREVGKVFGLSEDAIGALAGTLWGWGKEAVSSEHARRAGFDPADPRLAKVLALTRELIGFPRHLSQHVGGFVITRGRLDELVPIENAAMENRTVIEWDKDDLDTLRILKIDVLALGMLTCLRRSLDFLQKHYLHAFTSLRGRGEVDGRAEPNPSGEGASPQFETPPHPARTFGPRHPLPAHGERDELLPLPNPSPQGGREQEEPGGREGQSPEKSEAPLDLAVIPPEDPAVYRMLSRADSVGVFQVESRAQMTMLPRLKPAQFYDLVIEVAIVRPGPIQGDMVHPYLRRRQGLEQVHFPAPSPEHGPADELRQVLGKTLGVPLFQEQAMRIAIVAAGFTPSEADKLRRAMATFRRVGTIKYFRGKLIDGMAARGYPRDFAERCFNQIEGFGEYGFPESHAASFALLVYASAWIKCRYPDVFAAALLNSQPMGFYAPAQIVRDAQEHGVEVRPVDVNFSDWDNTLESPAPSLPSPLPTSGLPEFGPDRVVEVGNIRLRLGEGGHPNQNNFELILPRETGEDDHAQHGGGGRLETRTLPPPPPAQPSLRRLRKLACDGRSPSPATRGRMNVALCQQAETSRLHPRHAEMAGEIWATHAVRLGLRQISGLAEADARAIEAARGTGFDSVRDLWLRTKLTPAVLERLAQADAFRSLGLDRRKALWAVRALRRAGDKDDLPLFARVAMPEHEPDVALPPMRLGEHVIADYRHLHLSLKAHPASFLRTYFDRRAMLRSEQLAGLSSGRWVNVAGIVLVRQRPGTAKGVIFMTIEDETGVANIIVWPQVFEIFRPVVLGARLVGVSGRLQNESGVIHVVADRLDDLTPLLTRLASDAGCIDALVRCDEVRRPIPEGRIPQRAGSSLAALLKDEPRLTEEFTPAVKVRAIVPKARDFR